MDNHRNRTAVDYSYDADSRLLSIDNQTNSGQYEYAYTYDYVGDRMTMVVTDGGGTKTHVYGYDDIYQLTDVNYPAGYDYLATDTTFNYDPAGNRTTVIDDGGIMVYASNDLNQYTAVADVNYLYDDNGNLTNDGANTYTYDPENRLLTVAKIPDPLAAACDNAALTFTTGGSAAWFAQTTEYYYDNDAAQSGDIADSQETWLEATIEGEGTLVFWWKVSSENNKDWLEFRLDGDLQDRISGNVNWQQKSYAVTGAGSHTLKWRYVKDSSASDGSDCGWYIGTREGRRSLLLDKLATRSSKPASTQRRLYGEDAAEALLHKGLGCLRHAKADLQRDRKGAKWKVILACWIRQQTGISNRWLAEHVNLGAATGVSRLLQNERRQPRQRDPLWRKPKKC